MTQNTLATKSKRSGNNCHSIEKNPTVVKKVRKWIFSHYSVNFAVMINLLTSTDLISPS